jgi:hypothetical protein
LSGNITFKIVLPELGGHERELDRYGESSAVRSARYSNVVAGSFPERSPTFAMASGVHLPVAAAPAAA